MYGLKELFRSRKGNQRLIFILGMMVLGLMFVLLWYTAMEDWLLGTGEEVLNIIPGSSED